MDLLTLTRQVRTQPHHAFPVNRVPSKTRFDNHLQLQPQLFHFSEPIFVDSLMCFALLTALYVCVCFRPPILNTGHTAHWRSGLDNGV